MPRNLRDYGLGDEPKVEGSPKVGERLEEECPHCGAHGIFQITVIIKNPPSYLKVLKGKVPVGRYMGCAACPWASPMMTTAGTPAN